MERSINSYKDQLVLYSRKIFDLCNIILGLYDYNWVHIDDGLPCVESNPSHIKRPRMRVKMIRYQNDSIPSAYVELVCGSLEDDFEYGIAEVIIPFRDDLPICSQCNGNMRIMGTTGPYDCPWCSGEGVSVMDEGMRIAEALYKDWLGKEEQNGNG